MELNCHKLTHHTVLARPTWTVCLVGERVGCSGEHRRMHRVTVINDELGEQRTRRHVPLKARYGAWEGVRRAE